MDNSEDQTALPGNPDAPAGGVRLQWVLVGGRPRHVAEFAGLPPAQRPSAACPVCSRPVTLRLGSIRSHHAAHRPGDVRAATQPETAIHINAKYHLQNVLTNASGVFIQQICSGWRVDGGELSWMFLGQSCNQTRDIIIAQEWDQVHVELIVPPYRLDVALLKSGKLILGIEVLVTHRVGETKGQALAGLGLPWVEIAVDEAFYSGDTAWTAGQPLKPIAKHLPILGNSWRCPHCVKAKADAEYRLKLRQRDAARKKEFAAHVHRMVRFVDMYYSSGKRFRKIFTLTHFDAIGNRPESLILEQGDFKKAKPAVLTVERGPFTEEARRHVRQRVSRCFEQELIDLRQKGAITDSPMKWQEWPQGLHRGQILFEEDWLPPRYCLEEGQWRLIPAYRDLRWDEYWEDKQKYRSRLNQIVKQLSGRQDNPELANSTHYVSPWERAFAEVAERRGQLQADEVSGQAVPPDDPPVGRKDKDIGVCIHCGQATSDW